MWLKSSNQGSRVVYRFIIQRPRSRLNSAIVCTPTVPVPKQAKEEGDTNHSCYNNVVKLTIFRLYIGLGDI